MHTRWLMRRLRELLRALDVVTTADHGIDPDAKEAIAFAVLAHEFVSGRPGNLPSATGARRAALNRLFHAPAVCICFRRSTD